MHVSVFVGPLSRSPEDDSAVIDMCLAQAVEVAQAGAAMVTFGEQHYSGYEPYCNPFIMAGRVSQDLGDAWFGTTIVPLTFHNPLRTAEDASVVDLLLRGRFVMGMSMGRSGPVPDYANNGLDPAQRKEIFASRLQVLTDALGHRPGDPPLVVDTPWDKGRLDPRMAPLSYRSGGPQLAIGSNTDATIAMAAQRGWPVFLGPCMPQAAVRSFGLHRDAMSAAGATAKQVERAASLSLVTRNVIVAETDDAAWDLAESMMGRTFWMDRKNDDRTIRQMAEEDLSGIDAAQLGLPVPGPKKDPHLANSIFAQSWLLAGSPDSIVRQLKEYEALGIGHLNVRTTVGAYNAELMTRMHDLLVTEVLPAVGAQPFPTLEPTEIRTMHGGTGA
ncbi:LLM class flavin-dependent oxidoreductase [uncultured Friedmanniella sp.]|uniref:LLM class flavin-dependent oxidoreductase n=1 Tax=uncultured Friedmanniella sp. TaxID=335381 RepID=UPI0035CBAAD7